MEIAIIAILIFVLYKKDKKIDLLKFENYNLKQVMAQERLIPEEFVNGREEN